jgi:hypothetical protein
MPNPACFEENTHYVESAEDRAFRPQALLGMAG